MSDMNAIDLEFHAGDGGADAETFAHELASAVSKHSGQRIVPAGRVLRIHCL